VITRYLVREEKLIRCINPYSRIMRTVDGVAVIMIARLRLNISRGL